MQAGKNLLTLTTGLAFLDGAEAVGISKTTSINKCFTLLGGTVVEVVGVLARAGSLYLGKGADF